MFQKKVFALSQVEIHILKMYYSIQDLDYIIPKGISQTSLPSPKYCTYFRKGNHKFKGHLVVLIVKYKSSL
jgi:hypothetical protein